MPGLRGADRVGAQPPAASGQGLPQGLRPLRLEWDQRRWACREAACRRRTFAERSEQIGPGQRLTRRLRERLERAVSASTRSCADVAREYEVSWWSVNTALIARAALTPAARDGVRWLGVDETRTRSVRWLLDPPDPCGERRWRRSDPWMTSFVDLDPTSPSGLLGLAPGRCGASVRGWLELQSSGFRDGIEVVAVDPSAPFAAALRDVLPHATLVVGSPASASAWQPNAHPQSPPLDDQEPVVHRLSISPAFTSRNLQRQ